MTTAALQDSRVDALARVNAEDSLAALCAALVWNGSKVVRSFANMQVNIFHYRVYPGATADRTTSGSLAVFIQ